MSNLVDFEKVSVKELFEACPLYRIPKKDRKKFLQQRLHTGQWISKFDRDYYRREFRKIASDLIDLQSGVKCYLCPKLAQHRHHVRPIARGGANTIDNIVPLCIKCHSTFEVKYPEKRKKENYYRVVNPWKVKNFKSPLCKPKQGIVVIPPNTPCEM